MRRFKRAAWALGAAACVVPAPVEGLDTSGPAAVDTGPCGVAPEVRVGMGYDAFQPIADGAVVTRGAVAGRDGWVLHAALRAWAVPSTVRASWWLDDLGGDTSVARLDHTITFLGDPPAVEPGNATAADGGAGGLACAGVYVGAALPLDPAAIGAGDDPATFCGRPLELGVRLLGDDGEALVSDSVRLEVTAHPTWDPAGTCAP